jgi:hypothetical protein
LYIPTADDMFNEYDSKSPGLHDLQWRENISASISPPCFFVCKFPACSGVARHEDDPMYVRRWHRSEVVDPPITRSVLSERSSCGASKSLAISVLAWSSGHFYCWKAVAHQPPKLFQTLLRSLEKHFHLLQRHWSGATSSRLQQPKAHPIPKIGHIGHHRHSPGSWQYTAGQMQRA